MGTHGSNLGGDREKSISRRVISAGHSSILARAGYVETPQAGDYGEGPRPWQVLPVLVHAQQEKDPRDDPAIAKETRAAGRDRDHG